LQVSLEALKKRHNQGWLHEMNSDLDDVIQRIRAAKRNKEVVTELRSTGLAVQYSGIAGEGPHLATPG
jgi:urocanate hydratase